MAKVRYQRARKDYPGSGVKKGDMYYFAQIRTGPRSSRTIRSLERPKPSQLTSSEFRSTWLSVGEDLDRATMAEDIRNASDVMQELADETQDKLDNMPEGLQDADVGTLLQDRISAAEEAHGSLGDVADRLEEIENETDKDWEERLKEVDGSEEDAIDEREVAVQDLRDEALSAVNDNEPD